MNESTNTIIYEMNHTPNVLQVSGFLLHRLQVDQNEHDINVLEGALEKVSIGKKTMIFTVGNGSCNKSITT